VKGVAHIILEFMDKFEVEARSKDCVTKFNRDAMHSTVYSKCNSAEFRV